MSGDPRWSRCNNDRNTLHNVMHLNHLETTPPTLQPQYMEKFLSTKLVPSAKKVGNYWFKESLTLKLYL